MLRKSLITSGILVTALTGALTTVVDAGDGDLDNSYDTNGLNQIDFNNDRDYARGVVVQSDGKIVVVGQSRALSSGNNDFAIARFTSSGQLDETFDSDGKITIELGSNFDRAFDVEIQADGKIVVAGSTRVGADYSFAVVQLNSNGTLDNSFSDDGKATVIVGGSGNVHVTGMAIQSDGKIVITGTNDNDDGGDIVVARFAANGSLDDNFGIAGLIRNDVGTGSTDIATSVIVRPNGKIVVAGLTNPGADEDLLLLQYNSDGSLDTSFGTSGIQTSAIGVQNDGINAIVLQPDQTLLTFGRSYNGTDKDVLVTRHLSDGRLDTSFDGDGIATFDIRGGVDEANAGALQTDGKIILTGSSGDGSDDDFLVMRLNSNGTLDSSFSTDGIHFFDNNSIYDIAEDIAVQPNNNIVVTGHTNTGVTGWDFATARISATSTLSTLSAWSTSAQLRETFSSLVLTYTATVPNSTKTFSLTPTLGDRNSSITINGVAGSDGNASQNVALVPGSNTVTVKVISQAGTTSTTYSITVTRDIGTLKVRKKMTVKNLLATVDKTLARGSTSTVSVSPRSRKICSVEDGKVKGVRQGSCVTTVRVSPKPTSRNPRPRSTRHKVTIRII